MEDKNDKNKFNIKKMIVILGALLVMFVLVYLFLGNDEKDAIGKEEELVAGNSDEGEAVEEETGDIVKVKDAIDSLDATKSALKNLYRNNITNVGDGEEYPKNKTSILKKELLEIASTGDYGELIIKGASLSEKNAFSKDENLDIAGMLYDASLMEEHYNEQNMEIYGKQIAKSKTPEMLVIGTMFSDNFARRYILEDFASIGPVGYEEVSLTNRRSFQNPTEAEDELLYGQKNIVDSIFAIHEKEVNEVFAFDVTIDELDGGLPITAYVWEDFFGNIKLYGMYAPDDFDTYEKSIEWWMEYDDVFENAEEHQNQTYEENGKNGVITEEQIDKLFESGY